MKTILTYGVILGAVVVGWTFVMGFSGWYRHPALLNLFFLVIPIQIGLIVGMLSRTAAQGRGYLGQVVAGTTASVLGGVIIVGGSLLFTTVVFPNYFSELRAIQEEILRSRGLPEAEIAAHAAATASTQTPLIQAMAGFVGTFATGLVTSLVAGGFIRARASS